MKNFLYNLNFFQSPSDKNLNEFYILQGLLNCGGSPALLGSDELMVQEFQCAHIKGGGTAKINSFVLYIDDENGVSKD